MNGMDDLVTWLRAQLDDDERVAREAVEGTWVALTMYPNRGEVVTRPDGDPVARIPDHGTAEHIARHDPARVLAEVDAKRRILDEHSATDGEGGLACDRCSADENGQHGIGWWVPAPCSTVRLLGLPFTDRPGWREDWRP